MDKDCYVKEKDDWIDAEFMGVYQQSRVVDASPFVGGHPGGVNAYPIAVVKVEKEFREVKISDVLFKE